MEILNLFYSDYKQSFLKRLAADMDIPQFDYKPYKRRPNWLSEDALSSIYFSPQIPDAPTEVNEIFNKLDALEKGLAEIEGQVENIKQTANEQMQNLKQQQGYAAKQNEIQDLVKRLAVIGGLASQANRTAWRLNQKLGAVERTRTPMYQLSTEEKFNHGMAYLHQQYPDILQKLAQYLAQVEEGRKANALIIDRVKAWTIRAPKIEAQLSINLGGILDEFIQNLLEMLTYLNDVLVNVGEPLAVAAKKEI